MGKKTDNHNPAGKLDLRRHFLRTHHRATPPRVLDCCQATGYLWRILQRQFKVATYLGLDMVRKRGRLLIDSARFLEKPGWDYDVIDVDTYGAPWRHWVALLANSPRHPITVFLTIGWIQMGGGGQVTQPELDAIGLGTLREKPPQSLTGPLHDAMTEAVISTAPQKGWHIAEALEAPPGAHARYIGVRLLPA